MKRIFLLTIILGAFLTAGAQNKVKPQVIRGVEKTPALKKKSDLKAITISRDDSKFKRSDNRSLQSDNKLSKNKGLEKSNGIWDVQFAHDVTIGSGIETDGSQFYVSQWNSDTIFVYNLNGTYNGKFALPVTGIRDMAYDGTYFYGSDASNVIYKMNFTTHQIVDSIVCPAYISVRHIAYDNTNSAFWVGDWDSDIYLVNQSGTVINTISALDHNLYGMYGSAFDNTTAGGPYLWVFDQGGYGCDIVMIKISTGEQTGIIHDCTDDVASDLMDPIAGGLFIKSNLVAGTVTLGGIVQRQRLFGYDLSSVVANNDVGIEDVISPVLSSGCTLGSNESITVRLRNYGLNSSGNFTLHMNLNGVDYNKNVTTAMNSFATLDVTFTGTFNFSQPLVYKMQFNSSYTSDQNTSNDTAYYRVITGNGLISIDVQTDNYPTETYWEVYNNYTYDLYGSSDVMTDTSAYYTTDMCVDTNLCYGFTIFDDYGDGMSPPAYYEIFFNGNSVVYDDDFTGLFEEVPFIGHCDYADVGVSGILSPVSSCELGTEEQVTVIVKNYGTQTVDSAEVAFSIGGNTYSEPLPFSLNSLEEMEYTFVNLCDLSALAIHDLKIYSIMSNDMNSFNDTLFHQAENYTPAVIPYTVDFENEAVNAQLLVEDENTDYFTWSLYDNGGVNNSSCAIYNFNPNEPANDWLFSKCIQLDSGQLYGLIFYYKGQDYNYPEKLKVHLCQAPSSTAAFTETIIDLDNITDTTYTLASADFNVNDYGSGNYFLGFNVYSTLSGWNLYIDDISITLPEGISETADLKNQFTVYPNPAKDNLTIEKISGFSKPNNNETILIYNIQGKLIVQQAFNTYKSIIDLQNLEQGMYLLKVESEEGYWMKKFVKD
ncbi:MAG TPA: T9SS type A sorting domain-containing protein [Bacteroidales bacterium]|nr:T9SS type A sorting domain-containing protein [Bacteroidales bacterium]